MEIFEVNQVAIEIEKRIYKGENLRIDNSLYSLYLGFQRRDLWDDISELVRARLRRRKSERSCGKLTSVVCFEALNFTHKRYKRAFSTDDKGS